MGILDKIFGKSENLTDARDNQKELVSELIKPILDIVKLHVDMEKLEEERNNYIEKLTSRKQKGGVFDSPDIMRSKFLILDKELNLKKQEVLYNELISLSIHPQFLATVLNDFAYNQFEQKKYNEGLNSVALSIELYFFIMASIEDEIDEYYVDKLAGFLDTFSVGLYLKGIYEYALKISDILISLAPNDPEISEHLTNRGKIKLKLGDKEGAKLDFEEALEKDEYESVGIYLMTQGSLFTYLNDKEEEMTFEAFELIVECPDAEDYEWEVKNALGELVFTEKGDHHETHLITDLPEDIVDCEFTNSVGNLHNEPLNSIDEAVEFIKNLKTISFKEIDPKDGESIRYID